MQAPSRIAVLRAPSLSHPHDGAPAPSFGAPPDGYTLLVANSGPITVYPHLRKSPAFAFERDLEPVTFMISSCRC
jgi:hypothetical protein